MQTAAARSVSDDRDIAELLHTRSYAQAFEEVLHRYEGKVYRLCCALLREPAQAQDAAQESLLRIWKAMAGYDGRASLSTWIYAITRNRCLTALERRRAMDSLSDSAVQAEVETIAGANENESAERSERLRELVDLLPERQRQILVLYYFEECSISEVAQMLGSPEGTVKTHLFRARAALTEQLRQRGLDDPRLWLEGAS